LSKKGNEIRDEISKVLGRLTSTLDRVKEELEHSDDLTIRNCVKALASAQGQLFKAYFSLDPSYKIPLQTGETWGHFLAKNALVERLSPEDISAEVRIGDCVFDVVGRIGEEYVIIESETKSSRCIGKIEKIKTEIGNLVSGKIELFEEGSNPIFSKIKKQLMIGKPIRLVFAVTGKRKPNLATLNNIKKAESPLIRPEVYYVDRLPPFEISSDLLQERALRTGLQTDTSE
jgi:hypothetical protein